MRIPLLAITATLAACTSSADPDPYRAPGTGDPKATGSSAAGPGLLAHLTPHDVSIAFGLDATGLLDSATTAAHGPLLHASKLALLLTKMRASSIDETMPQAGSALKLVALRLDPCFGPVDAVQTQQCQAQIRLVFQPVARAGEGLVAGDGAVHVFYRVPATELVTFAAEIARLKGQASYAGDPLSVHPLIAKEGCSGAFATGLKAALLTHVGDARVERTTAFARIDPRAHLSEPDANQDRTGANFDWRFAQGEGPQSATRASFQGFHLTKDGDSAGGYGAGAKDIDPTQDRLDGRQIGEEARKDPTAAGDFDVALRVENPMRHTPDTVDCVTCHIAQPVRAKLETMGFSGAGNLNAFRAPMIVSVAARHAEMKNLHAFSFFGNIFTVNTRTANETSVATAVLDAAVAQLR